RFGLSVQHPDPFLLAMWKEDPEAVRAVAEGVLAHWQRLSGETIDLRSLLKRAGLPRLGKALAS
ncbi:MAG: PIN domain-containing protein, partial [Alphaproteobacteria bacterium]